MEISLSYADKALPIRLSGGVRAQLKWVQECPRCQRCWQESHWVKAIPRD
ncbi:MAG: hypothetical protein MZU84_06840 [Sphingobacterium sp.]|nr:hypothetical protein [Sphingobacterium sp.]